MYFEFKMLGLYNLNSHVNLKSWGSSVSTVTRLWEGVIPNRSTICVCSLEH